MTKPTRLAHYERDCPICGERLSYDVDPGRPMVATFTHCGQKVSIGRTIYHPDGTAVHNP